MNRRRQTYGWLLLLAFVLGSVLAPAFHFGLHAEDGKADLDTTDEAAYVAQNIDGVDCPQCDAPLLATSLSSPTQTAVIHFDTVLQRAPQRLALDRIGNTWDRGPPVHTRG